MEAIEKKAQSTLRLPRPLVIELKVLAARQQTSIQSLVERLVRQFVEESGQ